MTNYFIEFFSFSIKNQGIHLIELVQILIYLGEPQTLGCQEELQ